MSDSIRSQFLNDNGFHAVRLTQDEVLKHIDTVVETIKMQLSDINQRQDAPQRQPLHSLTEEGRGGAAAFLFDMDGVLFDSMPGHAVAWVRAVERYGLSMTAEEVYMNEGRTGAGTINALAQRTWHRDATELEVRDIYAAKSEEFNAYFAAQGEAPVVDGVKDVLDIVKARGLMRVIVTGSGQLSLLDNLNRHFPGQFTRELMVTAFDVTRGKPDPEPYLMGLQKAGVAAAEAVVVENAPLGIRSARAAGIYTIAVNTGPLPDSALWEAGANLVVSDMHALAARLHDWNGCLPL